LKSVGHKAAQKVTQGPPVPLYLLIACACQVTGNCLTTKGQLDWKHWERRSCLKVQTSLSDCCCISKARTLWAVPDVSNYPCAFIFQGQPVLEEFAGLCTLNFSWTDWP